MASFEYSNMIIEVVGTSVIDREIIFRIDIVDFCGLGR